MNSYLFYLIGPVITFSAGFYFYYKRQKLVKHGNKTEGIVVDVEQKAGDKFPVIEFKTAKGENIVQRYNQHTSKMRKGNRVPVYYNPDNPADFMIDNVSEKWAPLLLILISIVFLIMFIIFFPTKK